MRTYPEIVQQPGKVEDCHAERGRAVWGGVDLQEEWVSVNRRGLAYNPEYSNAKTNAGKIHQQIIAVQFDFRQQIQPMCCKHLMQVFTGGTFGRKHQNRLF